MQKKKKVKDIKKIVHTYAIFIFTSVVNCYPSTKLEENLSRGPFDKAYAIVETSNGYVFLGQTFQEGYDIWFVDIDRQGNILEQKTYGEVRKDEVAYSFDKTNDGGYILGGYTRLWSGYKKSYILKIKPDGQKEWEIEEDNRSEIKNVKVTSDGGFVVVGGNWVAKFGSNGTKQWEGTYRSSYGDSLILNWIEETSSGGYIAVGAAISLGGLISERRDLYILKIDGSGQKVWEYKMGGIGSPEEEAYCVQKTSDGNFIITGYEYDTDYQIIVLKLNDQNNSIEWIKSYGGPEHEFGHHIRETSDGGYIVVGVVDSRNKWISDIYILKLGQNGEKIWDKRLGGQYEDIVNFVIETSDGGYIIVGSYGKALDPEIYSEAYIVKLNANGNVSWERGYTHSNIR